MIKIKKNDKQGNGPLEKDMVNLLLQSGISRETVLTGIYGVWGVLKIYSAAVDMTANMPMIIEAEEGTKKHARIAVAIEIKLG